MQNFTAERNCSRYEYIYIYIAVEELAKPEKAMSSEKEVKTTRTFL